MNPDKQNSQNNSSGPPTYPDALPPTPPPIAPTVSAYAQTQALGVTPPNQATQAPIAPGPIVEDKLDLEEPGVKPKKSYKKLIITIGATLFAIIAIVFLAYFGYRYYLGSSNARILNAAAKNVAQAQNMSVNFQAGMSGISVNGELNVDKDQDLELSLENDLFPLELLYIKKDDKGYMRELDYSSALGSSMDANDQPAKEVKYAEYQNVQKAITKYGLSELGIDNLNPNKNYFAGANAQYLEREEDEKIDGRELYKFSFVPTDEAKAEAANKINESMKKYLPNTGVEKADTTAEFWIGKGDFKVYTVKGETKYTYVYQVPDYSDCSLGVSKLEPTLGQIESATDSYQDCMTSAPKKEKKEDFTFQWTLDISYDFNEDIVLPPNAKITSVTNLETYQEDQQGVQDKYQITEDDTTKKRYATEARLALEQYYAVKSKYPSGLGALVPEYIAAIPAPVNGATLEYSVSSDGKDYVLKIKLENEQDQNENVEAGYYVLRGKQ